MSVGKSVYLVIGTLFLAIFLIGCEGDQGPAGPNGFDGPDGPDGPDFTPSPIATQTFSLMINNGTTADFNGAAKIEITSDANATPSASRVVAKLLSKSPTLDGIDRGTAEWGDALPSDIALTNLFGADNGITTARVRVGYDRNYVYAQFVWTETATGSFTVNADTTANIWRFNGSAWSRSGGEDRLFVAWDKNGVTGWEANGISSIFDGATFKTQAAGERADLWVWQSTRSYYATAAEDNVVKFSDTDGLASDVGAGLAFENDGVSGHPRFMKSNSPRTGSAYPLLAFDYAAYASGITWSTGATIPGYITLVPTGSAADVRAVATFFSDTWIVELRRARNTGNADDLAL